MWPKLLRGCGLIICTLFLCLPASAQYYADSGWCMNGGSPLNAPTMVGGSPVLQDFQQSYPSCNISVYISGTSTLAPIYSNATGTPLTNPFSANSVNSVSPGQWVYFAAVGTYDVQLSGGGLAVPFLMPSRLVNQPFMLTPPGGSTPDVQYNNGGLFGGSSNFIWNNGVQTLQVTGLANTPAVNVIGGFIQAQAGLLSSANTWDAVTSNTDGTYFRGYKVDQNSDSNAGGYIDFAPITYNPYDSSTPCIDVYGNVVNQPVPLTGGSFGANDVILWVGLSPTMPGGGSCGMPLPINAPWMGNVNNVQGLFINSYFFARGGLATDNAEWNAIWVLPVAGSGSNKVGGGGIASNSFESVNYTTVGNNALATAQSGPPPLTLNDGFHPGSVYYDFTAGCLELFSGPYTPPDNTTGAWACVGSGGGGGGSPGGPSASVQFNNGGAFGGSSNFFWNNGTQLLDITAKTSSDAGLLVTTGFIQSDLGLLAINNASPGTLLPYNVIQAPTGGMEALSFSAANYVQTGGYSGAAPTLTTSDTFHAGALSWSTVSSCETVFNGSAWVCIGSGGGATSPGTPTNSVQFNSAGSFAGSANFIWNNGSQLLTITAASSTVAGIGVATGFMQADQGFVATSGTANKFNVVQAPTGGMEALSFSAVNYIQSGNYSGSAPALTTSDTFHAGSLSWSTTNTCESVFNGSAWACISGGGGGTPATPFGSVQFNNGGSFGGNSAMVWDNSLLRFTVNGITATPGIYVNTAYMQADGGFLATSGVATKFNSVQAPTGGMEALSFTAANYVQTGNYSGGAPTATTSDSFHAGALSWSNTSSCETAFNGSTWNCISGGSGTPGGLNTDVQYNNSGTFGGTGNFVWNNGSQNLTVNGITGTAGIAAGNSFIQSAQGFFTTSSSLNSVQTPGGIAAITSSFSSGGGNCSIHQATSISAIANCTTGATMWALGISTGSSGLLRLSNGSGSGGLDGDGAQILAQAITGLVQTQNTSGGFQAFNSAATTVAEVTPSGFQHDVSGGIKFETDTTGNISFLGHLSNTTGSTPAAAPSISGTSCSFYTAGGTTSSDTRGVIEGAAGGTTFCTVTFGTSFSSTPACTIGSSNGTGGLPLIFNSTASFLEIEIFGSPTVVNYICMQ